MKILLLLLFIIWLAFIVFFVYKMINRSAPMSTAGTELDNKEQARLLVRSVRLLERAKTDPVYYHTVMFQDESDKIIKTYYGDK